MWRLIEKKMGPPHRMMRYCCSELKEHGGEGRICVTGVRWSESVKRKNNRAVAEILGSTKAKKMLFNDNDNARQMFENCAIKGKRIINPIIDWEESDVWEYLNHRNIVHCSLYDEGWTRLGCIGCPLAGSDMMIKEFNRWPKYRENYLRAFQRAINERHRRDKPCMWETPEDVMEFFLNDKEKTLITDGQIELEDI
jgi:phosphoadenosine phosphosulfate reductase